MKKSTTSLVLAALFAFSGAAQAAEYALDKAHTTVGFKVRHLVSQTRGQFNDFDGGFSYDAKSGELSKVKAVIKTASVDTQNTKRDDHLRNADFFNVAKFPEMTFDGKKAVKAGANAYKVEGVLTMLGVKKPVTLDVTVLGEGKDPWGGTRVGLSATGKLNRKDFGMVFNMAMDNGGVVIGEEVTIELEIEGIAKK